MIKILKIGDQIFEGCYIVHSSFKKITNFISETNKIVSVANDNKYLSPNIILVSGVGHNMIDEIQIKKTHICLDKFSYKKEDLLRFESEIQFNSLKDIKILDSIEKYIKDNISSFKSLSLAFLIDHKYISNFKSAFEKAFVQHIQKSFIEFKSGEQLKGIKMIKGSGIGLTPSGDDFIVGILYALYLIEKIKKTNDLKKIRKSIYISAIGGNDISRSMLYHAYKGSFFVQLKDFLLAFINNSKDLNQYFKEQIAAGETSGSDILVGFYMGIKYFKKTNK